jgi:hypothetical protein
MVDALNEQFGGRELVVVSFDTARIPHAHMETRFSHMDSGQTVRVRHLIGTPAAHRYIDIPIETGINVPAQPLVCNNETHEAMVEINGDHVVIKVPYFYYETHDRVDELHYSITVLPTRS